MKLFVNTRRRLLRVLVSFAAIVTVRVGGTCTVDDAPCQTNAGNCTAAVLIAVTPGASLSDAVAALSYGKYCGALNKCQPVEMITSEPSDTVCEIGVDDPCPTPSCSGSGVDAACATHDACLDDESAMNSLPAGERLPVPQRCSCDVAFVAALAAQAATGVLENGCDREFYNTTIPNLGVTPIQLVQHEATLMAVPFCCDVLTVLEGAEEPACAQDATNNGYEAAYVGASGFCTQVLDGLKGAGLDICAFPDPGTPSPTTSSPTTSSPSMSPTIVPTKAPTSGAEFMQPSVLTVVVSISSMIPLMAMMW